MQYLGLPLIPSKVQGAAVCIQWPRVITGGEWRHIAQGPELECGEESRIPPPYPGIYSSNSWTPPKLASRSLTVTFTSSESIVCYSCPKYPSTSAVFALISRKQDNVQTSGRPLDTAGRSRAIWGKEHTNWLMLWHSYIWSNLDAKDCSWFLWMQISPQQSWERLALTLSKTVASCHNYSYFHCY